MISFGFRSIGIIALYEEIGSPGAIFALNARRVQWRIGILAFPTICKRVKNWRMNDHPSEKRSCHFLPEMPGMHASIPLSGRIEHLPADGGYVFRFSRREQLNQPEKPAGVRFRPAPGSFLSPF
jgi:hypothetical protein